MGNCNSSPNQQLECRNDFLFDKSSKTELIDRLIQIEQECLQSYDENSVSPIFPSNHFVYSIFLNSNLIFKKQNYDTIIKELKLANKTYEDTSFIFTKENTLTEKLSKLFYFNNPKELYESINQVSFTKETFKLNLNQKSNSNLFNCLLYIQLKNKYWIKNILYKADYKRKIFAIQLYVNSVPKLICLDESIPVAEACIPLFFNPPEKLYWVLLIEKAFAKIYNSYDNIIGLQASEIFPYLTDAPLLSYYHNIHSKSSIWSVIKKQLNKSDIIFVEGQHCFNLSFFVLGCYIINKTKYIELIIPDCSNKEALAKIKKNITIPEEDLKQTEFFSENKINSNKILFMNLDFYFVFFDKTHVLKYHNDYMSQVKRLTIDNHHTSLIKFKSIQQSNLLYLSIYALPKNTMIHRITVAREIDKEGDQVSFNYLKSMYVSNKSLDNTLALSLSLGTYYVIIQCYTSNQNQFKLEKGKIALSFYSSAYLDIGLKKDDDFLQGIPSSIEIQMATLFQSYLADKGAMQSIDNLNEIIYNHSISDTTFGYSLIRILNKSSNMILSLTIDYRIKGMNLLFENKREDNSIELIIPPSKSQMIIFEWYKSVNEVSIDLKPKFELNEFTPISFKTIASAESKLIESSIDLSYIVVSYFNGEFIILSNKSNSKTYKVFADVNEMINCIAHKVRNESVNRIEIESIIPWKSEKMINIMSIKQYKSFSYNISFKYILHQ